MSLVPAFALAALIPVLIGPLPVAGTRLSSITLQGKLCGGETIAIPLGKQDSPEQSPCHPKGCHAGTCRDKSKSDKLISRKDG
ncbi:MAG: hypothetical protein MUF47_10185 [Porphyrobacter sp.]|jgi:hypothetical protein|nr:hypothetical protein [Porphyrobacter sp.]